MTIIPHKESFAIMFLKWKHFVAVLWLALFLTNLNGVAEESSNFYTLNRQNGLSSNCVLQMLQMHDGRMVVVTD